MIRDIEYGNILVFHHILYINLYFLKCVNFIVTDITFDDRVVKLKYLIV
jgi:hypothetical protein